MGIFHLSDENVKIVGPDENSWYRVEAKFDVNDQTSSTLIFSGTGGHASYGALIDDVSVVGISDNDALVIKEGTPKLIDAGVILGNDTDPENDSLEIIGVKSLDDGHGTVELVKDAQDNVTGVTFTPEEDYNGEAKFKYTIGDGHGGTDTATVTLNVTPVDDASIMKPEDITVDEDPKARVIDENVLDNDKDVDNNLTVKEFTIDGKTYQAGTSVDLDGGTLTLKSNGDYTFVPKEHWSGSVPQVEYTTNTGSSSTLDITINPIADQPNLSITEDQTKVVEITAANFATGGSLPTGVTVNALNRDGTELTVSSINNNSGHDGFGVSGRASGDSAEIGYNSNTGGAEKLEVDFGTTVSSVDVAFAWMHSGESASYQLLDATGKVVGLGIVHGGSDGVDPAITLDADGQSFTKVVFSAPGNGDDYLINTISFTKATGGTEDKNSFTVNEGDAVDFNIDASLDDTDGSETLAVKVEGISEGLILTDGVNTFEAKVGTTSVDVTDWSLDNLSLVTKNVDADTNYTLKVVATATETNAASDNAHKVSTRSADINVTVKDIVEADERTVDEDHKAEGNVLSNDGKNLGLEVSHFSIEGSNTEYAVSAGHANHVAISSGGSVIGVITMHANGDYSFVPTANWNGDVPTITYTTNKGASETLDITVNDVNDIPNAVAATASGDEDADSIAVSLTGTDVDGSVDNVTIVTIPSADEGVLKYTNTSGELEVVSAGTSLTAAQANNLVFVPKADYHGEVKFSFTVTDNYGKESDPANAVITVKPVNDEPTAHNDGLETDSVFLGTSSDGGNISEWGTKQPDGSITFNTDGNHTVTISATTDGTNSEGISFVDTDFADQNGVGIGVIGNDNQIDYDETIKIDFGGTVAADSEIGLSGLGGHFVSGVGKVDAKAKWTAYDKDGVEVAKGTVQQDDDGTPMTNSIVVGKEFSSIVIGVDSNTTSNFVIQNVSANYVTPEYTTTEDAILHINAIDDGVLHNDTDPDGDVLTVSKIDGTSVKDGSAFVTLASGATVAMNSKGTFDYNPNGRYDDLQAGEHATDSFEYEISDGHGGTSKATVTVNITGTNDKPEIDLTGHETQVQFIEENGDFSNVLGMYSFDAAGNPTDPIILSTNTNTNVENPLLEIAEDQGPDDLHFFIVSNGQEQVGGYTNVEFEMVNGKPVLVVTKDSGDTSISSGLYFSDGEFNTDDHAHFIVEKEGAGYKIKIEDMENNGDGDFNDIILRTVEISPETDYQATFTENEGGVSISSKSIDISDVDDKDLESVTIILTNAKDGDDLDISGLASQGFEVTKVVDSDAGTITVRLIGSKSMSDYESAIKSIEFNNNSQDPDTADRTIEVVVSDGKADSDTAISTIKVVAVNDAPTVTSIEYRPENGEDTDNHTINLLQASNAQDAEGDTVTFVTGSITVTGPNGFDAGGVTVNQETGEIEVNSYYYADLNDGQSVTLEYSFQVTDGNGGVTNNTATITIDGHGYGDVAGVDIKGDSGWFHFPEDDILRGSIGNDTINGKGGEDTIYGDSGDDKLEGENGHDTIYGGRGNDVINGGSGKDTIYGNEGNDTIDGDSGKDTIYGNEGNDTLDGGSGNDKLYGGTGNDILDGGTDNDILNGGAGEDIFKWTSDGTLSSTKQSDTVKDFNLDEDTLDISDLLVDYKGGDNLDDYLSVKSQGGDTTVRIDTNGDDWRGDIVKITLQDVDHLDGYKGNDYDYSSQELADLLKSNNIDIDG